MDSSRSELLAGTVFVKSKRWRHKKRYAVACTGREPVGVETSSSEDRQAHLLIYKIKSGNTEVIERINFSTVLGVLAGPSGITLRLPDTFPADFKFRTKRSAGNKEWMEACTLLNAFPTYPIPRPPEAHKSLLRPELATLSPEYCQLYDAHDAWPVHVLPDSVANAWNILGLQIVAIGKGDMLKVINPTTGNTRLKVARHEILRCGFWDSMIGLEVSVGLRGILWMDCFQDQVKQMRDKIHNFAFYGVEGNVPPLPWFPSFFSDLPFSPRCYFDRSQRSRSNSLSSQSSDRTDAVSCSLELRGPVGPPHVKMTGHPSFTPMKLISPSIKYMSHSPMDHKAQKPELVHRAKQRRSILLDKPATDCVSTEAITRPRSYTEPISTKSCVTSAHKVHQPMEYCTPVSLAEKYIVMRPSTFSTS